MPGFDNDCLFFGGGVDPRGLDPISNPVVNQMSDGKLLIGSSSAPYVIANTLTAGTGISITNSSGGISIGCQTGTFVWNDATNATYTLVAQNGFITDRSGGVTYTLPSSGILGDTIKIVGKTGLATIAQNANQQIFIGNTNTTLGVGGSLSSTDTGDCLILICITAGSSSSWRTVSMVGNWNIV